MCMKYGGALKANKTSETEIPGSKPAARIMDCVKREESDNYKIQENMFSSVVENYLSLGDG